MDIKAKNAAGHYQSYADHYQIRTDDQAGLVEKQIQLSTAAVPWEIMEVGMENVRVIYAQSSICPDFLLQTEQVTPTVDLFLQLAGKSSIRRSGQPNRVYQSGQSNLVHTPAYEGELTLCGPVVATFVVQFATSYFSRFLDGKSAPLDQLAEGIEKGQVHALTACPVLITPAFKAAVYSLLHCPYKGLAKRLFLESKLLELVALQIDQLNHPPVTSLRRDDLDKLMAIREWLDANFLQPVTLLELARMAGLNDFKLKKGFREVFHTTVFTYLTDLRLAYAKSLLLDANRSVNEVADELGYSQIHHFTNAFKKQYGYLPRELKR